MNAKNKFEYGSLNNSWGFHFFLFFTCLKKRQKEESLMKNLIKTLVFSMAALAVIAIFNPKQASAETMHVYGNIKTYADMPGGVGRPIQGILIQCMMITDFWPLNFEVDAATTDQNGDYDCYLSYTAGANPPSPYVLFGGGAGISSEGESIRIVHDPYTSIEHNVVNAPEFYSPSGQWFARRFGAMTAYPIVHIEGYDPEDLLKSSGDVAGAHPNSAYNYRAMLYASELVGTFTDKDGNDKPMNAYIHILYNNYTLWLLLNGSHSGDSYRGTKTLGTDGLAYQAMTVVKKIAEHHKTQFGNQFRGLVVGGFSGGGLIARTGLLYWCNGDWANASSEGNGAIDLPSGCPDVAGWYSGDGPLEGAMMPGAAQKAAYDTYLEIDRLSELRDIYYETDYAAEVLRYTLPWYDGTVICRTGCHDGKCSSTSACTSYLSYYGFGNEPECLGTNCVTTSEKYDQFIAWAQGNGQHRPLRNGSAGDPLPGIAWAHGAYPGGERFYQHTEWARATTESGLGTRVAHFHTNVGGGENEHEHGSFFQQFLELVDLSPSWESACTKFAFINVGCRVYFEIPADRIPTYMPTTSALGTYTIGYDYWYDYNYQNENCAHIPGPPSHPDSDGNLVSIQVVDPDPNYELTGDIPGGFSRTDMRMLFAFVHEQMKGQKSETPICEGVRMVGRKGSCRAVETEVCNCIDDDGDECVDGTMTATGCQTLPNCSPGSNKVCWGPCVPSCHNKECGSDGCDGFCGTCGKGLECLDGQCQDKPLSCAADPSVVSDCASSCSSNPCLYVGSCVYAECRENCVFEECPGNGDDDGDTIFGAGIWDYNARSGFATDDHYSNGDDIQDNPAGVCYYSTGARDVEFLWRPSQLRYRDVNIAIWPSTQDTVLVVREGDCSGEEVLCTSTGPWSHAHNTRLDDFNAVAEQYCIIVDAVGQDGGYAFFGDIGQLRIWDSDIDEICWNNTDDDGDGWVDCEDWKCFADSDCYAPPLCIEEVDCWPHLWVTARNYEGNIWYYDGDNWRETDNYTPPEWCNAQDQGYDGALVWYADKSGWWKIDTFGSNYDTVLEVRGGGAFGSEYIVDCNNDAGGTQQSEVLIYAQKDDVYMIRVDTNGPINISGTDVEVNATYMNIWGGGCYGGLNHDWEFCQVACPCELNQGDCDTDAECVSGLICGENNGPGNKDLCVDDPASSFSGRGFASQGLYRSPPRNDIYELNQFDSSRLVSYQDSIKLPPVPTREIEGKIALAGEPCQASQCEGDFCNIECPCAEGEGDCDSDAECQAGLECGQDNGPIWGCGTYVDICFDPANPGTLPQLPGGGCNGDLRCDTSFCHADCPCLEGQGDCDPGQGQCAPGLICGTDNGADWTCSSSTDVCIVDPAISGGGCNGHNRCHVGYCDPSCPCNEGYGHCRENADCATGLVCASNIGEYFDCPASVNICATPEESGGGCRGQSQCEVGFCSPECPCLSGQGHCSNDDDCVPGASCQLDLGAGYGCASSVNICLTGPRRCESDYCAEFGPCSIGDGNCNSTAECGLGLLCLSGMAADFGCEPGTDICMIDHISTGGGCYGGDLCDVGYCHPDCRCLEGQGQCDTDSDCHGTLRCLPDNDDFYGCGAGAMMCQCRCSTDDDCDDGLSCNGTETCDGCFCQAGTPVECDDGVSCTEDTCNETTGCEFIPYDFYCWDSYYCNGAETCDPVLDCQAGTNPCGPGETCNEATDSCEGGGGGGNIGYTTVFGDTTTIGERRAQPVTATTAGDLQSISIYHRGGSGGLLLAVYEDDGGLPGTRLGITPEVQISSNEGWQTVNLPSPVTVSAGQLVWLAWLFENNPGIFYQSGTPGRANSGIEWSGGMPSDFGSSSTSDFIYSIYATYSGGGCTPDCTGKECGDDGCGGSCGTCSGGESCVSGVCTAGCTPDCTGKECGDDGCGGSCGTCSGGESCVSGTCEAGGGLGPELITNGDFSNWTSDNPDGWTINGESGSDPMITEVSGACRIYSSATWVAAYQYGILEVGTTYRLTVDVPNYVDGSIAFQDGAENTILIVSSGEAQSVDFVAGGADFLFKRWSGSGDDITIDNVSVREVGAGCTPDCTGKECGDDGCGGSCGTCPGEESCVSGVCIPGCTPDCTGKECGDDGCGGSCGTCSGGEVCNNGTCDSGSQTTDTWQVTAADRDVWSDGNSCDLTSAAFGDDGWSDSAAYQFAVTIPQGATIVSANLEVWNRDHWGVTGAYTVGIRVENVDNAAAFTCSSGNEIHGRSYWSTTVNWSIPSGGLPQDQWSNSPDIASLIQQIVDRPGWSSGNYISLAVWGETSVGGATDDISDYPNSNVPQLTVTYSTGGSCTPDCTGKECGDDGCGGSCGTCSGGEICNNGTCESGSQTTDTWLVTAADRDVWSDGSSCDLTAAYFGDNGWSDSAAFQFAVTIPQGATIVSANLELWNRDHWGATSSYTVGIRVENVDNAAAFTCSSGSELHDRTYWSTTVNWSIPSGGLPTGQYSSSPDIASLIQQIVNRPGWSSGNYISLAVWGETDVGGAGEDISDYGTSNVPKLTVTYTSP
jgi:hypothetical protein